MSFVDIMDTTGFKFSKDKKSFSYKSEAYIFEGPARNNNVIFRCRVEGCNASLKLNCDLTKVVGGSSIHNHLRRFSPQSRPDTAKGSLITKQEKLLDPTGFNQNNPPRKMGSPNTSNKHNSPAASIFNFQSTTLSRMTDKDNDNIDNRVPHNVSSDSTFTETTLQSQNVCDNWINVRNGLIDKIADQEIEITKLKSIIESLQNELTSVKNNQLLSKNSHNKTQTSTSPTESPKSMSIHKSWSPSSTSSGGTCFIIGDSHVRGLVQQFQSLVSSKWSFESVFQPGAGFKVVANTHTESSSLITPKPEDAVILVCGTNDICTSSWDEVQQGLESLLNRFHDCHSLCLVGVPLRHDSRGLNKHIIRFNTKVKNFVLNKNKHVFYLDPTRLIKPKFYKQDKVHLNANGKRYLCNKIGKLFLNKITLNHSGVGHNIVSCSSTDTGTSSTVTATGTSSNHISLKSSSDVVMSSVRTSTRITVNDSVQPLTCDVSTAPAAISTPSERTSLSFISSFADHGIPVTLDSSSSSLDTSNASQYVSFIDPTTPVHTNKHDGPFNIPIIRPITRSVSKIRNSSNFQE